MPLKTATIDDLLSWEPCYDEDQIRALAGDRTEFNAMDVLRLDIPAQDRLWVVLRPELLDDRTLRLFACNCAEHVLHFFEDDCPEDARPRNAIAVARHFANNDVPEDEFAAAWAAARGAAWDARAARAAWAAWAAWATAWYAARAAWATAWYAARAARAAAWDAAWAARADAWDAAWAARADARTAETDWQVSALIDLINAEEAE